MNILEILTLFFPSDVRVFDVLVDESRQPVLEVFHHRVILKAKQNVQVIVKY